MDDTTNQHEDRFHALAERRLRDAIQAGEFDNLPGRGQPLAVEENPFVPEDWRLAFKVLQNAGVVPDWIMLASQIDADIATWRRLADEHFATVRARLDAAAGNPYALRRLRDEVATLKVQHARATARHAALLGEINRKINTFNMSVPIASLTRLTFVPEVEMRAWDDRLPAYLTY